MYICMRASAYDALLVPWKYR